MRDYLNTLNIIVQVYNVGNTPRNTWIPECVIKTLFKHNNVGNTPRNTWLPECAKHRYSNVIMLAILKETRGYLNVCIKHHC